MEAKKLYEYIDKVQIYHGNCTEKCVEGSWSRTWIRGLALVSNLGNTYECVRLKETSREVDWFNATDYHNGTI